MFNKPVIIASNNLDKTAELIACLQQFQVAAKFYQDLIPRVSFLAKEQRITWLMREQKPNLFLKSYLKNLF